MKTKFFSLLLILCFFLLGSCSKENLQLNNETKPDAFEQLRQDINALNQKFFATPSYQKDYIGDSIPLGTYPFDALSRYRMSLNAQVGYFKTFSLSEDWAYSAAVVSAASWWTAINQRGGDNEYDPTFINSENPITSYSSDSIEPVLGVNDPGALHNQIVQGAFTQIGREHFLESGLSGIESIVGGVVGNITSYDPYYFDEDVEWVIELSYIEDINEIFRILDVIDTYIGATEEIQIFKDYCIGIISTILPRQVRDYTIQFAEIINNSSIPQFSKELLLGTLSIGLNNSVLWNMQLPDPDDTRFLILFNDEMNMMSQIIPPNPHEIEICPMAAQPWPGECVVLGTIQDPGPPCFIYPGCIIQDPTLYIYDYHNPNSNLLSLFESGSYHVEEDVLLEYSHNGENFQIQINSGNYPVYDWNGEVKIIKFTSQQ